jgi:predicted Zn-dependent peptidase
MNITELLPNLSAAVARHLLDTVHGSLPRPIFDTPENRAARALSLILGQGRSSRLYQHLVKEKQLAIQVSAFNDNRIGPSLFYISAVPRPGVKVEDLEKAIDEEIAAVKKDGVTAQELTKAKAFLRRQWIQTRSSDLRMAVSLGDYAVKFNDPDLINTLGASYDAVTVEQVNDVAKKYFDRDQRAVVITLPAKPEAGAAKGGAQ